MDPQFDISNDLDGPLLDLLCQKNESSTPEESVLDLLCRKNESLTPNRSHLKELCQTLEESTVNMVDFVLNEDITTQESSSLIDSASPDELKDIYREMKNDDGAWHNQEYAFAEVERRLKMKQENKSDS